VIAETISDPETPGALRQVLHDSITEAMTAAGYDPISDPAVLRVALPNLSQRFGDPASSKVKR
jgi:hypothetical protein